jgi:hypothetical protein
MRQVDKGRPIPYALVLRHIEIDGLPRLYVGGIFVVHLLI